ncbi:MAG: hypothetical protein RL669_930, partial [Pseudomonadota bacterium]
MAPGRRRRLLPTDTQPRPPSPAVDAAAFSAPRPLRILTASAMNHDRILILDFGSQVTQL